MKGERVHLEEGALQAEELSLMNWLEVAQVLLIDQVQTCHALLWQVQEGLGLRCMPLIMCESSKLAGCRGLQAVAMTIQHSAASMYTSSMHG